TSEVEVDRHGIRGIEQWMARADEPNVVFHLDVRPTPRARDRAARNREVDRSGRLDERLEYVGPLADRARELAQDALGLLALLARDLRVPVVQLHHVEGL